MTAPTLPFTNKVTRNSSKRPDNRILSAQFGNGFGQYAKDGLNSRFAKWDIQMAPITGAANIATMEAFLNLVGSDVWFTWTPLGETVPKKWRIDKGSERPRMIHKTSWEYNFTITQCFDLGT